MPCLGQAKGDSARTVISVTGDRKRARAYHDATLESSTVCSIQLFCNISLQPADHAARPCLENVVRCCEMLTFFKRHPTHFGLWTASQCSDLP
jgi:hypothetical protein